MAAMLGLALLAGCASVQEPVPVFCYRTLADIACYEAPDPGREGRLVGVHLLDPDDPALLARQLSRMAARMSR
jgi:hypothetical protein